MQTHHTRKASARSFIGLSVAALVAALCVAQPAAAGDRHHDHGKHNRHRHARHHALKVHSHRHHVPFVPAPRHHHGVPARARVVYSSFVVPEVIEWRSADGYRRFYRGEVYDRRHRHHHDVYYFPVSVRGSLEYRPHFYCGDRLLTGRIDYHGPRLSLSLGF